MSCSFSEFDAEFFLLSSCLFFLLSWILLDFVELMLVCSCFCQTDLSCSILLSLSSFVIVVPLFFSYLVILLFICPFFFLLISVTMFQVPGFWSCGRNAAAGAVHELSWQGMEKVGDPPQPSPFPPRKKNIGLLCKHRRSWLQLNVEIGKR